MKRYGIWVWLGASFGIHVAVAGALSIMPGMYRDSQILVKRGTSSIEFVLVNSVESVAVKPRHAPKYEEVEKDALRPVEETVRKTEPFAEEEAESNYKPDLTENSFLPAVTAKVKPLSDYSGPFVVPESQEREYAQETTKATKQIDSEVVAQKVEHMPHKHIDGNLTAAEQASHDSEGRIGDELTKGSVSAKIEARGKPNYPRECLINGHEGRVIIEITILADGKNGGMTIIESSGCDKIDQSAMSFLRECTLIPKMLLGKPVDSKKQIAFKFELLENQLVEIGR